MKRLKKIINNKKSVDISQMTICIKSIGILSKSIEQIQGEQHLRSYFDRLIQISEKNVL